jgi:hypothetical protein
MKSPNSLIVCDGLNVRESLAVLTKMLERQSLARCQALTSGGELSFRKKTALLQAMVQASL